MAHFKIKKGNLYNGLTNKIDSDLLDSSQYDLELNIAGNKSYYRLRYNESYFNAHSIDNLDSFILPINSTACTIGEIDSFISTYYFKHEFPYKKILLTSYHKLNKLDETSFTYYAYLKRITQKSILENNNVLYNFSIPAIGYYKKVGVNYYNISIECVRNRYYLIFIKELVTKGYLQRSDYTYMIYDRDTFINKQEEVKQDIVELVKNYNWPYNLTSWLVVITGGSKKLLDLCKHELNLIKQDVQYLFKSPMYTLINSSLRYDPGLRNEFIKYINGKQNDINYNFKCKILK